jgi:CheY-like chemotaxis protein
MDSGAIPENISVLVVDQDKSSRLVVASLLKRCGYQGTVLTKVISPLTLIA